VQLAADYFHDVDTSGERIGNRAKAVCGKGFGLAVFARDFFGVRSGINRLAIFRLVMCRVRRVFNDGVEQSS
jgi:hypothetical protein